MRAKKKYIQTHYIITDYDFFLCVIEKTPKYEDRIKTNITVL